LRPDGDERTGTPLSLEVELRFLAECAERRLREHWSALDQSRRSQGAVRRLDQACVIDVIKPLSGKIR
jgi:hypothetical protein